MTLLNHLKQVVGKFIVVDMSIDNESDLLYIVGRSGQVTLAVNKIIEAHGDDFVLRENISSPICAVLEIA